MTEPPEAARRPFLRLASIRVAASFGAVYLGLALLNTWPMPVRLFTHLPHDLGDPVVSTTLLHWNAVTPLFTERWWNGVGFHPLPDTLTFSDPRVGLYALGVPVWWTTGSAVAVYNVLFVVSFALSAIAMHALVFSLTRSHGAALVAGCAYGFAPFRAWHLAHLELLASYWMPVALLGLHRWLEDRRSCWLAVFGAATTLQGLFCAYYLPMFAVLGGLWVAWFGPGRLRPRELAALLSVALVAVAALLPLFLHYRAAHEALGFTRGIGEIELYSADLTGLWSTPPELRFWPSVEVKTAEGYLFPGITAVLLVIVAIARGRREHHVTNRVRHARTLLLVGAGFVGAVALFAYLFGPIRIAIGGLQVSITELRKPASLVIAALVGYLLLHPRVLAAWRARSPLAFYALATGVMILLALGPSPAVGGVKFLYRPPYAWLMSLPGFDETLRAPARFGMLMALTLSVAAGLAWSRLGASLPRARMGWISVALAALVLVDGWSGPMSAHEVPERMSWPRQCARLPRLELPFKGIEHDAAAQYRALLEGVRSVNGTTGFVPPHMLALVPAIQAQDPEALTALAEHGSFCVAVERRSRGHRLARFVVAHPLAKRLRPTAGQRFYFIQGVRPAAAPAPRMSVPIAAAQSDVAPVEIQPLVDGNATTGWSTPGPQRGGESLTVTLGCAAVVTDLSLSHGGYVPSFARDLAVDVSGDGTSWRTVWRGATGGLTAGAALRDPHMATVHIPIAAADVTHLRLRSLAADDDAAWALAELRVLGRCESRQSS